MANFIHLIAAIDTHAAGEPTRIVLSGLPPILGATMAAKKQFMRDHLDHFHTLLMHEPRGHRDMFGAVLTPPTTPRGQYGLLFMDNAGYLDMCGHGTMSVTTVLIETGMIPPLGDRIRRPCLPAVHHDAWCSAPLVACRPPGGRNDLCQHA